MIAAIYARKSNDQKDRAEDAKSTRLQIDLAREYAQKNGWAVEERFIFEDDGISGAEFERRPGLQALLAALSARPQFQALIISEQSRLGREQFETAYILGRIAKAGVRVYTYRNGEIALKFMVNVQGFADEQEREKTRERITERLLDHAREGHVAGGKVFGYRNEPVLNAAGKRSHVERVINPAEAATVIRIFEATANGLGLFRIAKTLNAERVPGPRGKAWSASGVREVLRRELYVGKVVYGKVHKDGTKTRTKADQSQWTVVEKPELRVVSDKLWSEAHARVAATNATYMRHRGLLGGMPENLREGKYLLSGHLSCGVPAASPREHGGTECGEPLIAVERAGQRVYVCRGHRSKGDTFCTNETGVPMEPIHSAVIRSLRESLTVERFEAHLRKLADDTEAREARVEEYQRAVARIGELSAEAERLANAIALGNGSLDVLLNGIKARELERKACEARLGDLDALKVAERQERNIIERLRAELKDWHGALEADPALARQYLRQLLAAPIAVFPHGVRGEKRYWTFAGIGRADGVLAGAVDRETSVTEVRVGQGTHIRGTPITKASRMTAQAVPSGALVSTNSAMNPL